MQDIRYYSFYSCFFKEFLTYLILDPKDTPIQILATLGKKALHSNHAGQMAKPNKN